MKTDIESMDKSELRAGMPIDIVFESEINQPNAHYMKAVIYECSNKFIVTSQTSPALTTHFLKRRVLTTYLVRVKNRMLRFGFSGLLTDLISDYAISSGKSTEALVIKKLSEPQQADFRMFFRVKPPSEAEIRLFLQEQKVNLLDVSIGGAKFTHPRSYLFRPGDSIKFKLIIDRDVYDINAHIRSVQEPDINATNRSMQYISVEFHIDDKKTEVALGKAILDIERSLLSRGTT